MVEKIQNDELGASVRSKLNDTIDLANNAISSTVDGTASAVVTFAKAPRSKEAPTTPQDLVNLEYFDAHSGGGGGGGGWAGDSDLDMKEYKVINLKAGNEPEDAINKTQLDALEKKVDDYASGSGVETRGKLTLAFTPPEGIPEDLEEWVMLGDVFDG